MEPVTHTVRVKSWVKVKSHGKKVAEPLG
jgi:hypothetical protein